MSKPPISGDGLARAMLWGILIVAGICFLLVLVGVVLR